MPYCNPISDKSERGIFIILFLGSRKIYVLALLTAFPSLQRNAVTDAPDRSLRNVLGFYIDRRNGWLWAPDQGFVAGERWIGIFFIDL